MNQILYNNNQKSVKIKSNFFYKFIFYISIVILFFLILWFFYKIYTTIQNDKISQKLITSYSISTLFSNDSSYKVEQQNINNPFVIRYYKN